MPPVDPFAGFSNEALFNVSLALNLSCARTKSTLRNPVRKVLCNALLISNRELDKRGAPFPFAPYHVGDLKRDAHGVIA